MRATGLMIATVVTAAFIGGSARAEVIEGDVIGVDGRASKGAEVRIQAARAQTAPIVVKTDARGHFVASNVAAGGYNISALASGVSSPVQAVKVQPNKPVIVAFDLRNNSGAKTATKGGKKKTKFVWMPDQTGSHLGGHWVEVDEDASAVPTAQHLNKANGGAVRDLQSREVNPGGSGR